MENKKFCKFCGKQIDEKSVVCPNCGRQLKFVKNEQQKKEEQSKNSDGSKFYIQPWFMWVMLIFFAPVGIFLMWKFHNEISKKTKIILTIVFTIFFVIVIAFNGDNESVSNSEKNNNVQNNEIKKMVDIIDFSQMNESEILLWCKDNNLNCNMEREYSDTIAKDEYIRQSVNANEQVEENSKITVIYSLGKKPTIEQDNALKKAKTYAKIMHMSKSAIYDQLISEYGEGFDTDSAQYAIDNIEWDWESNALEKAKTYRDTMHMSKNAIYDQLISEYGEKFTASEAQYAIDHLDE